MSSFYAVGSSTLRKLRELDEIPFEYQVQCLCPVWQTDAAFREGSCDNTDNTTRQTQQTRRLHGQEAAAPGSVWSCVISLQRFQSNQPRRKPGSIRNSCIVALSIPMQGFMYCMHQATDCPPCWQEANNSNRLT